MSIKKRVLFLSLIVVLLSVASACTWVKLTPAGEKVSVAAEDAVTACKKIGKTTVSLKAEVIGVKRKSETVETELSLLARNSAAKMGGNTVVPASKAENGEKTFFVFNCEPV